jgi:hypothetical protein
MQYLSLTSSLGDLQQLLLALKLCWHLCLHFTALALSYWVLHFFASAGGFREETLNFCREQSPVL